jgi:hypothetical protein
LNTYWRCEQPLASYGQLPIRVRMDYTTNYLPPGGAGAVQLGDGCRGDGNPATTDLILDIRGDGRTYGPGDDAIRLMNSRPGATDIQVEGHADCGQRMGAAHQDGIQILGGTNIVFRNFTIGDYDGGRSTCQGAGGAVFYSLQSQNIDVIGGKFIACNHALLAGTDSPGGEVRDASFRSGRTDGTDPICNDYAASPPCIQQTSTVTLSNLTCQLWNPSADRWDNDNIQ